MKIKIFVFIIIIFTYTGLFAELANGKWEIVHKAFEGKRVFFSGIQTNDKKNIIITGQYGNPLRPFIIKSTDSGRTYRYTYIDSISLYNVQSICLDYPTNDFIFNGLVSGKYLISSDGGESWTMDSLENKEAIYDVDFWDNKTGLIVQDSGQIHKTIHKTTDGGINWNQVFEIDSPNLKGKKIMTFDNGITYFTVQSPDSLFTIYKSTDYGESWDNGIKGPKLFSYNSHFFVNKKVGFLFCNYIKDISYRNIIYKTSDGGLKWKIVLDSIFEQYTGAIVTDMDFIDSLNGMATCMQMTLRTENGGENWFIDPANYENFKISPMQRILLLEKYKAIGLATNTKNEIYWYMVDSVLSVKDNLNTQQFDIFPNPAVTHINVTVPDVFYSEAEYSIYTIDGKEMKKGIAAEKIEIENLPSGSYYIILSKGEKLLYSKFVKE
jgi:hypothetical protein